MSESVAKRRLAIGGGAIREIEAALVEVRKRLDTQRERLDRQAAAQEGARERQTKTTERLRDRLDSLRGRQEKQGTRLAELAALVAEVEKESRLGAVDLRRAMQQLASLEERVGRLEESQGERFSATDQEQAEARSLVEEVRREHEQVRVRFQVITMYEERLRRLESAMSVLYQGDERHPL